MMKLEMKKLIAISSTIGSLIQATVALAVDVNVNITPPSQGIDPIRTTVGQVISNLLTLVFSVAIIVVLFYLIFGAFEWITSGGEKEAVGKARGRIINALIGLAILALAFLIARVAGDIVNINIFDLKLPALGPKAP